MGERLGYTHPVSSKPIPNPSMGIGETEHTPLEVATVYSTLADEGVMHAPVFVHRVEDVNGRVLYRAPVGVRVIAAETARTVTDVLSHVTDADATAPRAKLADRPVAGKTGTVDHQVDAWFAGYTPQLVAAVWMGNKDSEDDQNRAAYMTHVGEFSPVFGGTYPALIWQKFMTAALKGQPVIPFRKPDESLWPQPAQINPAGGRGSLLQDLFPSTTTSSTPPVDSTTTTSGPTSTTSSSPTPPPTEP
jgi:penicillin-binding protein 1A